MFDMIFHSLFTLATTTAAFYAGVKLTERHHHEKEVCLHDALDKQRAIMRSGSDRVPIAEPYTPRHIPETFGERLQDNKRATYYFPGGAPAKQNN